MNRRKWHVQVQGEDGLFRTIANGTHDHLSTAYAQYDATEGIRILVRDSTIVLRSDHPDHQPASSDQLF